MLVNPSISESFGMSVIEAMASGCPVVVARTGGMKSLVQHEVTGLAVPPEDPGALAVAMARLLEDQTLAERCVHAGRAQTVQRYDWSRVAAQTLALHANLARSDLVASADARDGTAPRLAYEPGP